MKDNEIIKALECCSSSIGAEACKGCPFNEKDICDKEDDAPQKYALDLINRQKAEIERYKGVIKRLENDVLTAKTEAIKDILLTLEAEAESSDKYIREYDGSKEQRAYNQALWKAYNLVKEMTEQSTGYGSSKTEGNERAILTGGTR